MLTLYRLLLIKRNGVASYAYKWGVNRELKKQFPLINLYRWLWIRKWELMIKKNLV